ncbi:uncharacterized protein LOC144664077 [Oculina patagonica]
MVKLLLVIGAFLAVTVSRTEGTVTLPSNTLKVQPGRNVQFSCQVTDGENFVAWITPAKAARPGKPGIPSVENHNITDNRHEKNISEWRNIYTFYRQCDSG